MSRYDWFYTSKDLCSAAIASACLQQSQKIMESFATYLRSSRSATGSVDKWTQQKWTVQ